MRSRPAIIERRYEPDQRACVAALELLLTPKNSVIKKGRPTTNGPDEKEIKSVRAIQKLTR